MMKRENINRVECKVLWGWTGGRRLHYDHIWSPANFSCVFDLWTIPAMQLSCLYIKTLDTLLKIETIVTLKEALYRCLICLF